MLLDRSGHVIATGYNGVASGLPHCNEYGRHVSTKDYPNACAAADAPSGQSLDGCQAIHAEQNALLQCREVREIQTAYVTASPCMTCTKLLLNTGCKRIVYLEEYPHATAKDLWLSAGREWVKGEYHADA